MPYKIGVEHKLRKRAMTLQALWSCHTANAGGGSPKEGDGGSQDPPHAREPTGPEANSLKVF